MSYKTNKTFSKANSVHCLSWLTSPNAAMGMCLTVAAIMNLSPHYLYFFISSCQIPLFYTGSHDTTGSSNSFLTALACLSIGGDIEASYHNLVFQNHYYICWGWHVRVRWYTWKRLLRVTLQDIRQESAHLWNINHSVINSRKIVAEKVLLLSAEI